MPGETELDSGSPRRSTPQTLEEGLTGKNDNALNALRLLLALLVIIGHTPAISGVEWPAWTDLGQFGAWSVSGFFAISGYLIVGSRLRSSWWTFGIRRVARIFPGYWVQLVVVAFMLAPLATVLGSSGWNPGAAIEYVVRNVTTFDLQYTLDGTRFPYFDAWNGSAWTLMYEVVAYAGCLIGFSIPWCRRHPGVVSAAALLATTTFNLTAPSLDVTTNLYLNLGHLGSYFAAGMLIFCLRSHIVARWPYVAAAALLFCIVVWLPGGAALMPLPWAYVLLAAGMLLPVRVGSVNDLSYGVYIYAFPIQQIIAMIGFSGGIHLVTSTVLTVLCAALSWRLVERPALRAASAGIRAIRARTHRNDPDG